MKVTQIDHVAIAVRGLEQAAADLARNFDLTPERGGEIPALGIRNRFLPIGPSDLELIEPLSDQGPVAEFLQKNGEGVYLLSLRVDDLDGAVAELRAQGLRVSDPMPAGSGGRLAFVSPRGTHGVNLQLIERR